MHAFTKDTVEATIDTFGRVVGRCVHSDLGGYLGLEKQQFALLIVWGPNKSISGHDLDLISFYEKVRLFLIYQRCNEKRYSLSTTATNWSIPLAREQGASSIAQMMGSFISSIGSAKPFRGDRARNGESDHCGGDTGTISSEPTILQVIPCP